MQTTTNLQDAFAVKDAVIAARIMGDVSGREADTLAALLNAMAAAGVTTCTIEVK